MSYINLSDQDKNDWLHPDQEINTINTKALIQYKDVILHIQEISLWR